MWSARFAQQSHELVNVKGLPEYTENALGAGWVRPTRHHHDRKVGCPGMCLQPLEELEAVHARHHEVQDDEAGALELVELPESVRTVHSLDDSAPSFPKQLGRDLTDIRIVLHDKDRPESLRHGFRPQ